MKYKKEYDEVSLDAALKGLLFKELDTLNTSSHDLLQEKKRVWNELETSIQEINRQKLNRKKIIRKNWSSYLKPALAISITSLALATLILIKEEEIKSPDTGLVISKINHTLETEYRLPQTRIIASNIETKLPETLSSRVIKDFERQNQLFFIHDLQVSKADTNLIYVNNDF